MRNLREVIAVVADWVFPWPARHVRRSRIEAARRLKEEAREGAVTARNLAAELHELRKHNHVREALDELVQRRAQQQREEGGRP